MPDRVALHYVPDEAAEGAHLRVGEGIGARIPVDQLDPDGEVVHSLPTVGHA